MQKNFWRNLSISNKSFTAFLSKLLQIFYGEVLVERTQLRRQQHDSSWGAKKLLTKPLHLVKTQTSDKSKAHHQKNSQWKLSNQKKSVPILLCFKEKQLYATIVRDRRKKVPNLTEGAIKID